MTRTEAEIARARYRLGFILVTISAVAWSTTGFFTRLIPHDSATLLFWRGLFGGLGILAFIVWQERKGTARSFWAMGRPAWAFALVSAFGMLCFITSFQLTTVAHVAIIYATVPFLAAGLAWFVMRERPALHAVLASFAALMGVGLMVGLGSRMLPAIETGLIGSLDAPLAPIWVWLAFSEIPTDTTLVGGLIVFVAVVAHVAVGARSSPAATEAA